MDKLVQLNLRSAAPATIPSPGATAPPDASVAPSWSAHNASASSPGAPCAGSNLTSAVDRLLQILTESAPNADPQETSEFLLRIERHRDEIKHLTGRDLTRTIDKCLIVCEAYFRQSRRYVNHREKELLDIVALLRGASAQMAGDSSDFNTQVIASSERLMTMSRLDDLRELKQRLSAEVSELRMTAVARHKHERETFTHLTARVETLQTNLVRAEEEASLDGLTQVANRGTFDRTLRKMFTNARKSELPFMLAMLDIDHFKGINDQHGHPVGDRVILCTAQAIRKAMRKVDCIARYGGEEFAVLLPDAKIDEMEDRFKKLLADIAAASYDYEVNGTPHVVRFTVSCGLAELEPADTEADLVRHADEALYEAKRKGRNRVMTRKRSMLGRLFKSR